MNFKRFISKNIILPFTFLTMSIAPGLIQAQNSYFLKNQDLLPKSSLNADTLWGNGFFLTKNAENGTSVGGVSLYLRSDEIDPDTTYEYTTNNNGVVAFNLPVHITPDGLEEIVQNQVQILPNFGSELNAFFSKSETGLIELYDIQGKLVRNQEINSDHEYLNLSELNTGIYAYIINTSESGICSGKFIKTDSPTQGSASRPMNKFPPENGFKGSSPISSVSATYLIKGELEGYYTDSTLIDIYEGTNTPITFNLTPVYVHVIDNQDFAGVVVDPNNNYAALANAIIEAYVISSGQSITTTSESDGSFTLNGVPLGKDILFSAGGISGKGSVNSFPYTTPQEIPENSPDSVWSHFGVVLPDNPSQNTSWTHIGQQNLHGTHQDTIWYYQDNTYNPTQKENNRIKFANLQADENNIYAFAESFVPLTNIGITMSFGTYNTQAYPEGFVTPLGNVLNPVLRANTTMDGASMAHYVSFVHEIKLASGYDIVGWHSVMKATAPAYTDEDREIADISRMYWNSVYEESHTHIPINYIKENMPSRENANQNNLKEQTTKTNKQINLKNNKIDPNK